MAEGLRQLHAAGIASLDIKMENYLLGNDRGAPVISDLGCAIFIPRTREGGRRNYSYGGCMGNSMRDPLAQARHGFRDGFPHPEELDRWAFGATLLTMLWPDKALERALDSENQSCKQIHNSIRSRLLIFGDGRTKTNVFLLAVVELVLRYPLNCNPARRDMFSFVMLWNELLAKEIEKPDMGNLFRDSAEIDVPGDAGREVVKQKILTAASLSESQGDLGNLNNPHGDQHGAADAVSRLKTLYATSSAASTSSTLQATSSASTSTTLQATSSTSTSRSTPGGTPSPPSILQQAAQSPSPKGKPDGAAGPGDEGHKNDQATPTGGSGTKHGGDVPLEVMEVTPGAKQSFETSNQHQEAASSQSAWNYEALQPAASSETPSHEQLAGNGKDVDAHFDATGAMTTDITAKGAGGTVSSTMASAVQTGPGADNAHEDLGAITSSYAASAQDKPSTTTTATDAEQNAEQDSAPSTPQIRLEQDGHEVTSQDQSSPTSVSMASAVQTGPGADNGNDAMGGAIEQKAKRKISRTVSVRERRRRNRASSSGGRTDKWLLQYRVLVCVLRRGPEDRPLEGLSTNGSGANYLPRNSMSI
ncbi:unnamed protein product [Amoebophrya sp. A25]|nr:unnamed protein product [Amoebophrya sp. A25]|eukprot:GSA25T00027395001.1